MRPHKSTPQISGLSVLIGLRSPRREGGGIGFKHPSPTTFSPKKEREDQRLGGNELLGAAWGWDGSGVV